MLGFFTIKLYLSENQRIELEVRKENYYLSSRGKKWYFLIRKNVENLVSGYQYGRNFNIGQNDCRKKYRKMFFYGNVVVAGELYSAVEVVATTLRIKMDNFQMFLKFSGVDAIVMMVLAMLAQA